MIGSPDKLELTIQNLDVPDVSRPRNWLHQGSPG